jgi:ribonuclease HII
VARTRIQQGPSFEIEAGLFARGYRFIAGVDEAGRGALAGPLVLGMVIYDACCFEKPLSGEMAEINDSKKLTPRAREYLREVVASCAISVSHCCISHGDVDRLNINGATFEALRTLVAQSRVKPDCVIMDGNFNFSLPVPYISVIGGDSRSVSIASASIEAKVARDTIMIDCDVSYPGYGFAVHKGYGTQMHRDAIMKLGPTDMHRKSYEPVRSLLSDTMESV